MDVAQEAHWEARWLRRATAPAIPAMMGRTTGITFRNEVQYSPFRDRCPAFGWSPPCRSNPSLPSLIHSAGTGCRPPGNSTSLPRNCKLLSPSRGALARELLVARLVISFPGEPAPPGPRCGISCWARRTPSGTARRRGLGTGLPGPAPAHEAAWLPSRSFARTCLAQPQAVQHFYDEIQAVGQLTHPNIVGAYDAGPIGRTHFFAMEHVEGIDLERMGQPGGPLARGGCLRLHPPDRSWSATRLRARCLRHHDLRPANLRVAQLAKRDPSAGSDRTEDSHPEPGDGLRLTDQYSANSGLTILPPSGKNGSTAQQGQAEFRRPNRPRPLARADIRADLYRLGSIFYFLLTGRVPFAGGDPAEKLQPASGTGSATGRMSCAEKSLPRSCAIVQQLLARNPCGPLPVSRRTRCSPWPPCWA